MRLRGGGGGDESWRWVDKVKAIDLTPDGGGRSPGRMIEKLMEDVNFTGSTEGEVVRRILRLSGRSVCSAGIAKG